MGDRVIFKDEKQRPIYNEKAHPILKCVARILDALIELMALVLESKSPTRHEKLRRLNINTMNLSRDLVVTEFIRPPREGKPSFHPKGQAIDTRTRNLPGAFIFFIKVFLGVLRQIDRRIQYVFEETIIKDGVTIRGQHFHIEYDTGDPV